MKSSAKKVELAPYDDLFSTEESRQDAKLEKIREIPLSELHPFKNHPFEVKDDEAMMETADSVRQYTAPLLPSDLKGDTAEQLFYRFNNEHPADYRHPSMSVSDIVAIKRDGKVTERTIHKTKQHRPPKHQRSGAAFVVFQFFSRAAWTWARAAVMRTAPDCADGTKRVPEQEYSILAGVAQRQRRHSCFMLDALVVVKVGVTVYHLIGYRKDRRFVSERLDEAVPRKRFVILDTHDGIGVVNVRYLMPVIVYDSGSRFLEAAFFVLCENRKR